MIWCFSRFFNMAAAVSINRYCLPRSKRGLVLVVKNTAMKLSQFKSDFSKLEEEFRKLRFDIKMLDADEHETDFLPSNKDLSEYNVLLVIVVSDSQDRFEVINHGSDMTLDIGKITESLANNDSMLGYPKILLFVSKSQVDDESLAKESMDDGAIIDETGQAVPKPQRAKHRPHEKLVGESTFFWDIFVAKVVPQVRQISRFFQDFASSVQKLHKQKDFEKIFLEVIESNKPVHWQYLNHLRKKLFLTKGKITSH